ASLEIQSIPNGERTFKHKPVTTTIGPSFAYYVPITSTFYYTPQFDVAAVFGAYSLESSLEKQTINYSGVAFGISPVKFEFRPTDHFGLDVDIMSLTYAHMNYKLKDSVATSNTLGFKLCINPSVGFKYYF
ncbi:MAG: hypothetical protein J6T30_07710, partial [Bacteroidales bacterium]|nr:hypothetical protein [Bacteroidales bacterium]